MNPSPIYLPSPWYRLLIQDLLNPNPTNPLNPRPICAVLYQPYSWKVCMQVVIYIKFASCFYLCWPFFVSLLQLCILFFLLARGSGRNIQVGGWLWTFLLPCLCQEYDVALVIAIITFCVGVSYEGCLNCRGLEKRFFLLLRLDRNGNHDSYTFEARLVGFLCFCDGEELSGIFCV